MQNRVELDSQSLATLKEVFRSHFNYDTARPTRFYHDAALSAQLHEYAADVKGSRLDRAESVNQVYDLFLQAFAKVVATKYSRKIESNKESTWSSFFTPTADVRGEFDACLANAIVRSASMLAEAGEAEASNQLQELVYRFQQLPKTLRESTALQFTTLEKVIADYLRTGLADKRLNDLFTSTRLEDVSFSGPSASGNTLFNTRFHHSREGSYEVTTDPILLGGSDFDFQSKNFVETYTAYYFDIEAKQVDLPRPGQ